MPENKQPYQEQSFAPGDVTFADARPAAPPAPKACNSSNIFDCLVSGSLLLFFCLMSWSHGETASGNYAFFRGGAIPVGTLRLATALAAAAVGLGFVLLFLRIRHIRYCAAHFPKPKKQKGPNAWADLRDALEQLLGLKPYESMNKEAAPADPVKKRRLRNWFGQEKTRIGLSTFILLALMYLTPGFILHLMGTHVLLYFLLEFMAFMTTLLMWLIAWVELGE